jgi:histidine ammonia-lyase
VLALGLAGAETLALAADIAAAMSIDALRGSIHPFESRVHAARPFKGQLVSAANIESLMRGSGINQSHEHCGKVQDAYSLRCAAQVHGAVREALRFVRETVDVEANSATDNPMVFADSGDIVSGGNFHGAPIAIAADLLAAAIVPLATISERRTDRLVDPARSGLPAFLTRDGGLQSGYMMAQVTAAALASELKTLAHPAGVDTIPTSANKEDHVSMSMTAALKAERAVSRAREVIAIELLCACQAIDLLAPLATSPTLARVHALVRSRVPVLDGDRSPAPDIVAIAELIATRALERACGTRVK